ncbi:MAG: DUF3616 domain-containing protein [Gemmataceae bacterium]|nr:DUF3616 domain-containing protein [Gemmataceae bacterium]MDW8267062.1 DUF3616 domain-containing protein [Gemmataceae bacterium]
MMNQTAWSVAICGLALGLGVACDANMGDVQRYVEMCDASAAVALSNDLFVVANDEDNVLRVYSRSQPGKPLSHFDLSSFLGVKTSQEADIEGGTRLGDHCWWVTSHARNSEGADRPTRRFLLATRAHVEEQRVVLAGAGRPYPHLLRDLLAHPPLKRYRLAEAAQLGSREEGALNIEGLAATPEGTLLIGFRAPVAAGKALLVPLHNPGDLLQAGGSARLGEPIELDLGGLGIRGLEYWPNRRQYVILAGPAGVEGPFRLYLWSGKATEVAIHVRGVDFRGCHPETALVFPGSDAHGVYILSDDGSRTKDGRPCKDLPLELRSFRGFWVKP